MYALGLQNHTCIMMSVVFIQVLGLNLGPCAYRTGIFPTELSPFSVDSFLWAYLNEAIDKCEIRGHSLYKTFCLKNLEHRFHPLYSL